MEEHDVPLIILPPKNVVVSEKDVNNIDKILLILNNFDFPQKDKIIKILKGETRIDPYTAIEVINDFIEKIWHTWIADVKKEILKRLDNPPPLTVLNVLLYLVYKIHEDELASIFYRYIYESPDPNLEAVFINTFIDCLARELPNCVYINNDPCMLFYHLPDYANIKVKYIVRELHVIEEKEEYYRWGKRYYIRKKVIVLYPEIPEQELKLREILIPSPRYQLPIIVKLEGTMGTFIAYIPVKNPMYLARGTIYSIYQEPFLLVYNKYVISQFESIQEFLQTLSKVKELYLQILDKISEVASEIEEGEDFEKRLKERILRNPTLVSMIRQLKRMLRMFILAEHWDEYITSYQKTVEAYTFLATLIGLDTEKSNASYLFEVMGRKSI